MIKITTYSAAAFLLSASAAFAAGLGGGLPWDGPLTTISTDLTVPTAAAICLIGIAGIFMVLIFGGELNYFVRQLCFVVAAGSTLVGVAGLFTTLGVAGAEIDSGDGFWSLQRVLISLLAGSLAVSAGQWLWRRWQAHRYFVYSFMMG